jgi:nucleotide-binding universal stress UspA family protein
LRLVSLGALDKHGEQCIEAAVEGLDWEDGNLLMLGSSRLAPPRRLFVGPTAARILRVLQVPIVVTPGEE